MSALATLQRIARLEQPQTARAILEARLGRPLGPLATMPRDLRRAPYLLALHLQRTTK